MKKQTRRKLSPKILIVAPIKRLSWQYHHRRAEIWRVIQGQVGVVRSITDSETELADFMSAFIKGSITIKNLSDTYDARIATFAQTFVNAFEK